MTPPRPRPGVADYAWAAVAVLIVLAFLAGLGSALWQVATQRGFGDALWLPVGVLCAGWLAMGAWRRTVWGRREEDSASANG
jgi:hypothetical protein